MFLLIRKLLTCLTVGYQTFIYRLSLMLAGTCPASPALRAGSFNLARKVVFYPLLKEEQDLYQVVEIVPLMSTVTGG